MRIEAVVQMACARPSQQRRAATPQGHLVRQGTAGRESRHLQLRVDPANLTLGLLCGDRGRGKWHSSETMTCSLSNTTASAAIRAKLRVGTGWLFHEDPAFLLSVRPGSG